MVAVNNASLFLHTVMFIMNQSSIQEGENVYNYYLESDSDKGGSSKCYGIYGCFDLSPPWTSTLRPVSVLPQDIETLEPKYPMYTRNNPDIPVYFDLDASNMIRSSGIEPMKPVYIISHGYMEGGFNPWITKMAKELLKREDCSVIVVDWSSGSGPPYTQAVANIRLLGAMTAHLLEELTMYTGDLKLDHVHCIGHSLGAHLCGYVGYALQKDFGIMLGRITGLDPAEPHFSKVYPPVRLDRTAARYVDVIHTDASQFLRGGLGMREKIGHVDFYPNDGTNQPGCGKTMRQYVDDEAGSFYRGVRKFLGCNHVRSHELFSESINTECSFLTYSCSSFDDFMAGKCFDCGRRGEKCIPFGFRSRLHYDYLIQSRLINPRRSMVQYLVTGERFPFCRGHYRVTVKVSDSEESRLHGGEIGQVLLTMHSTSDGMGSKSNPVGTPGRYFKPGATYTDLVATDEIKELRALEIQWQYNSSLINPLTWRILASPRIFLEKVTVHALEINERITVCPKNDKPLINGQSQFMIEGFC